MANPKYSLRMNEHLAGRLDAWGEERGLKDSEAIRRLVERGLEAEQSDGDRRGLAYLAESVALIMAVCAGVLAPLSVTMPTLQPFALAYLGLALLALAAVLWSRGVRLGGLPTPWRRSA